MLKFFTLLLPQGFFAKTSLSAHYSGALCYEIEFNETNEILVRGRA